jgi:hypothetical protein
MELNFDYVLDLWVLRSYAQNLENIGVRKELTGRYDPFRNRAANWLRTIERISLKDMMENQSAIKKPRAVVRLSKIVIISQKICSG